MEDRLAVPEENLAYIQNNIKFAHRLARKFYRERENLGVDLDDYIGSAELGLCDAARRFDSTRGQSFETFAYARIRGSMSDLLRRSGSVPRSYLRHRLKQRAKEEANLELQRKKPNHFSTACLNSEIGGLAPLETVIEQLGYKVHICREAAKVELSYADQLVPEEEVIEQSVAKYLRQVVEQLEPREREVITRRYYLGQSFEDMRSHFGQISKSWLSRLHARALDHIRQKLCADWSSMEIRYLATRIKVQHAQ